MNLYNFGLRWYDPEIGRFVSKDPIGMDYRGNFYLFCDNNPVNLIDPTGGCRRKPKPSPSPTPTPTPGPGPVIYPGEGGNTLSPEEIRAYIDRIGPPPPLSSVPNPQSGAGNSKRCACPKDVNRWVQSYCRAVQSASEIIRDQYRRGILPDWVSILFDLSTSDPYGACIRHFEDQYGCNVDHGDNAY